MAQAAGNQCPVTSATFSEDVYQTFFQGMQERFTSVGILGGLYGVLTILSVLSAYALTQRSGKIQPTAIILCLTLFVFFASTTTHMITSILSWQTDFATVLFWSGRLLWSDDTYINFHVPLRNVIKTYSEQLRGCAGTTTLTINVVLSDAIVCWRACVIWQHNRAVCALCAAFLLATFALGAADTTLSCNAGLHWSPTLSNVPVVGAMYKGFAGGLTACVLSLATNVLATVLVGWKAWESRRQLHGYFVGGSVASQVEKLFALLIESGAIYCAFWAVVIAFQLLLELPVLGTQIQAKNAFVSVIGVFLDAALVPLIAIYPTVIIVFVALHRSHVEKALTHNSQSVPTPHLSLTLGTAGVSSHHDDDAASPLRSRVSVWPVSTQNIGLRSSEDQDAQSEARDQPSKVKIEGIV